MTARPVRSSHFTHSSLTHSLTRSRSRSLNRRPTHPLTHPLTHSAHWRRATFVVSCYAVRSLAVVRSFVRLFVGPGAGVGVGSGVRWNVRWLGASFRTCTSVVRNLTQPCDGHPEVRRCARDAGKGEASTWRWLVVCDTCVQVRHLTEFEA